MRNLIVDGQFVSRISEKEAKQKLDLCIARNWSWRLSKESFEIQTKEASQ